MLTQLLPMPARFRDTHDSVLVRMRDALLRSLGHLRQALPTREAAVVGPDAADHCDSAAVLRFPIRGEALLVNLASTLRGRVAQGECESDPFLMTISRSPRLRLSLDRDAYVEFLPAEQSFRLQIDAAPASRLTLETVEFVTLVKFIMQYLAERRGDPEPGGAAT